jgi:hypothetical protein
MKDIARVIRWAIQTALIGYSETPSGMRETRQVMSHKQCLYLALEIQRALEMAGYKIIRAGPQPGVNVKLAGDWEDSV